MHGGQIDHRGLPFAPVTQIGARHHLVDRAQVIAKSREVAALLASKPPGAMRLNKRRFREITEPAFEEAFASGPEIEAEAFASGEPQKAMEAFFARRK